MTALTAALRSTRPRIYVACLAAYNSGRLHGEWIDLDDYYDDPDDLMEHIRKEIIDTSPAPFAEEWAIHDYENFAGYEVSEGEDFAALLDIAAAIDEHGPAVGAYLSNWPEWDASDFDDKFQGIYDSETAFVEEYIEICGDWDQIPEHLRAYIDVEYYGKSECWCGQFTAIEIQESTPWGFSVAKVAVFANS